MIPHIVGEDFTPHWALELTNEQYHADKTAVSSTGLRKLLKSPYAFMNQSVETTAAMAFGSAVHLAVLEPKEFENRFILEPKFSGTGSVKAREEFRNAHKDAVILKQDAYEDLMRMLESVLSHREANHIIKNSKVEQSGYYRDPETGIKCRIRTDFFWENMMILGDLKTTQEDCSRDSFSKAIYHFRYDIQIYMYCLGIELITGKKVENALFLAVEKTNHYEVALYEADEALLFKGKTDYELLMKRLKTCIDTNRWDRYQQKHQSIGLPHWAYQKELFE